MTIRVPMTSRIMQVNISITPIRLVEVDEAAPSSGHPTAIAAPIKARPMPAKVRLLNRSFRTSTLAIKKISGHNKRMIEALMLLVCLIPI